MKMQDLREKSAQELALILATQQEMVRELRFKVTSQELKGVRDIRVCRQTIARVLTLMTANK